MPLSYEIVGVKSAIEQLVKLVAEGDALMIQG